MLWHFYVILKKTSHIQTLCGNTGQNLKNKSRKKTVFFLLSTVKVYKCLGEKRLSFFSVSCSVHATPRLHVWGRTEAEESWEEVAAPHGVGGPGTPGRGGSTCGW